MFLGEIVDCEMVSGEYSGGDEGGFGTETDPWVLQLLPIRLSGGGSSFRTFEIFYDTAEGLL